VRAHKRWKPGDVQEFTGGVADILVRARKAEWVEDEQSIETATAEPRAEQQTIKRKRGRPRKNQAVAHG